MPVAIALILRQIIMALATGAVITGVQELLNGTIQELVREIKDTEGVTEQDAKDIVANILVDLGVNSVTVFTVLKSGIAVKAVEFLGLTSRGFIKKTLIYPASSAAARLATEGGLAVAKKIIPKIVKIAAVPGALIWLASALANIIEPGIYKPEQTNALYQKLGIPFQYPTPEAQLKPGPFSTTSSVTFSDFAKSLETAGVRGIEDPFAMQSRPYSRQALADLINGVFGREVLAGSAPSVKQLLPLISPYLVGMTATTAPVVAGSPSVSVAPITKVFTGIVSQGVVGQGLTFTPRPDDMIESVAELRQAAANNLAPYLNALLGKIVYEVKVVASIITKEGFRQTGTTQQVKTGTYANGQPKYKTVTNKFATLVVYALTDKGSRAKLTTIVLGPTNSSKLAVSQTDMRAIETALPAEVTTTNINEITGIATASPITVTTPQGALAGSTPATEAASEAGAPSSAEMPTTVSTGAGYGATTLSEWYQSQGQALPSVESRSKTYESLGLGNAAYYTGTAEQNTRLLDALKNQSKPTGSSSSGSPAGGSSKDEDEPKEKEEKKEEKAKIPPKPKINYTYNSKKETQSQYNKRIEKERKAVKDWEKKYG